MSPPKSRALAELLALGVCAGLNFAVEAFLMRWKLPILSAVAIGWGAYLWRRRAEAVAWGFRTDNLGEAARPLMILSLAGLLVLRPVRLPEFSGVIFLIYPLWGLVQQFALQVLLTRNLQALGAPVPALLAGMLFGAAHLPDLPLSALTAAGGVVWTSVYLRTPNLWALGLCHAWLGTLAYYGVLGRDPWFEMFVR